MAGNAGFFLLKYDAANNNWFLPLTASVSGLIPSEVDATGGVTLAAQTHTIVTANDASDIDLPNTAEGAEIV